MNQRDTSVRIRLIAVQPLGYKAYGAQYGIPDSKYRKLYEGKPLPNGNLQFDLELRARRVLNDDTPNFLGAWVIGTPDRRALYLQWNDPNNDEWNRRLKVILSEITWQQIRQARDRALLGEVPGQRPDGGPANGVHKPDWTIAEAPEFEPIGEA
jgi:hypothetical protein